jgi:hypothetical protein
VLFVWVALSLAVLSPARAHADGFQQTFTVPGWTYYSWLGNLDFSSGPGEILMVNNAGGYFGIFNSGNGALELPLFAVKPTNGFVIPFDYEGDGTLEFATRTDDGGSHRSFDVWHSVGGNYVTYYSHHDPVVLFHTAHLRSASTVDLIEYRTNDIVVRDVPTGAVLWQASTNIPGWHGTQPLAVGEDVDGDGLAELEVTDYGFSLRVLKYNAGTWQTMWYTNSPWAVSNSFNSDNDPHLELALYNPQGNSGHGQYAVCDGMTGASELDLSAFTGFSQLIPVDQDGDGRSEILMYQNSPSLVRAYAFNGSGYTTLFSHTDPTMGIGPIHMRAANQTEYLESSLTDLRIRDTAGNVLFRASTGLSNWTSGSAIVTSSDINHDGHVELLIQGNSREWMLTYNAGFHELWSHTGRQVTAFPGNVDADTQDELLAVDNADHSYMLLDGLTGAQQKHWTQYTSDNSFVTYGPWENNGRNSLLFGDSGFSPSSHPADAVWRWDGGDVSEAFHFADSALVIRATQNRSASLWELEEHTPGNDLILRDAVNGSIRFQASRQLAGWTGLSATADTKTLGRVYDERNNWETLINETARMTVIRRNATLGVPGAPAPRAMRVLPSMPNPFHGATTLRFDLPRDTKAQIRIFDAAGRVVRTLDRALSAGENSVEWDGLDNAGHAAPNGVLFYELNVEGAHATMKMVRLR